jgi:hypothetical protein
MIERLGYATRVQKPGRAADMLLATADELTDGRAASAVRGANPERIVIVGRGGVGAIGDARAAELGNYRRIADAPTVFARV